MAENLTFAALKEGNLDHFLQLCEDAARQLQVTFDVPNGPSSEAKTWIGAFENGWIFALADPACWELLDVFARVAREQQLRYLSGSTDDDFRVWSYEFSNSGQVEHQFSADPTGRYREEEYYRVAGNAEELAREFGVRGIRLRQQLRQFAAPPVHDFFNLLGFDIGQAKRLRFVNVGPGVYKGPSTLSVVMTQDYVERVGTSQFERAGETTKAFKQVERALDQGYGAAAELKAERFATDGDFKEVHDLFLRLRKTGKPKLALAVVDKMLKRIEHGDLRRVTGHQLEMRTATIHGLRGLALSDMNRHDEAIVELKHIAMRVNQYVGPQHRASISSALGGCLVKLGRFEEALRPLRLCLAERPLHAETWANLARAAHGSGRLSEARNAAQQCLAAEPDFIAREELMSMLGLRDTDLLPPRDPKLSKMYRREAQSMVRSQDRVRAITRFKLSLHHSPDNLDCAWGVACAVTEAIREGAIRDDKHDHEVLRLLEQVAFGNSGWPWGWGSLIELLDRRGQRRRALDACEAYARHHATSFDDLMSLGSWLAQVNAELGVVLLDILVDRFIELRITEFEGTRDEAKFQALSMLGWALMQIGRIREAIQPMTQAAQLVPDNVENLANLADAHIRAGNHRAASRAISRGLKTHPKHPRLTALSYQLRG